jgi:hypothetical protein
MRSRTRLIAIVRKLETFSCSYTYFRQSDGRVLDAPSPIDGRQVKSAMLRSGPVPFRFGEAPASDGA